MRIEESNGQALDTLRLSQRQQELLREHTFRQGHQRFNGADLRAERRVPYEVPNGIDVHISHPGGNVATYRVRPRDISSRGLGFFHGNFIHSGTACTVLLTSSEHGPSVVAGRVVRCRLLSGHIHEVGVCFDDPIDVNDFINPTSFEPEALASDETLPEIVGRIVHVNCGSRAESLNLLVGIGVSVQSLAGAEAAIASITREPVDMVVLGPGEAAAIKDAAASLRAGEYRGPLLALTLPAAGSPDAESLDCNAVLDHPFTVEQFVQRLAATQFETPESAQADASSDGSPVKDKAKALVVAPAKVMQAIAHFILKQLDHLAQSIRKILRHES